MITMLYIVSHILYDHRILDCTPPHPSPCGVHCHCSTNLCSNSGNVAAGKGYDHVPTSLDYPRDDRSEMDRDSEGQPRGMTWPACKQFLAILQVY